MIYTYGDHFLTCLQPRQRNCAFTKTRRRVWEVLRGNSKAHVSWSMSFTRTSQRTFGWGQVILRPPLVVVAAMNGTSIPRFVNDLRRQKEIVSIDRFGYEFFGKHRFNVTAGFSLIGTAFFRSGVFRGGIRETAVQVEIIILHGSSTLLVVVLMMMSLDK